MAWNMTLASLGQLPHLCPLPNLFHTPPTSFWGGWGLEEQPWCCVSAAQHQLKHCYIITTILATATKHSPVWATVRKGNSVLDTVHKYVSASNGFSFPGHVACCQNSAMFLSVWGTWNMWMKVSADWSWAVSSVRKWFRMSHALAFFIDCNGSLHNQLQWV